jgi:hypothetical protein
LAETYAHPNSDVMQSVMGVDAMPTVKESVTLTQYKQLVEQGDLKEEAVIDQITALETQLSDVLGRQHPDMIKMTMVKRRREVLG